MNIIDSFEAGKGYGASGGPAGKEGSEPAGQRVHVAIA